MMSVACPRHQRHYLVFFGRNSKLELGEERQLDYLQAGLRGEESRRRVVWDTVAALVQAGFTAHTAIDKIYEVYAGQDKTVTQIVNQMM